MILHMKMYVYILDRFLGETKKYFFYFISCGNIRKVKDETVIDNDGSCNIISYYLLVWFIFIMLVKKKLMYFLSGQNVYQSNE